MKTYIAVFVVILAIAGGFLFFKHDQTPTDLSGELGEWETYRNNEYGFEFKYPPHTEVSEKAEIDNNGGISGVIVTWRTDKECDVIPQVELDSLPAGCFIGSVRSTEIRSQSSAWWASGMKETSGILGGLPAVRKELYVEGFVGEVRSYANKNDKDYVVSLRFAPDMYDTAPGIFDSIVDSFKFID